MKYGSMPRSLVRFLADAPLEPNHAPDGLTEKDIDALISEADTNAHLNDLAEDQQLGKVIPLRREPDIPSTEFGGEAA